MPELRRTVSRPDAPTTIEAVQQVRVQELRPALWWYWIGAAVLSIGLLVAFLVLIIGAFGFINGIDSLQRVPVDEGGTVRLGDGGTDLFHEPEGGVVGPLSEFDLVITDVDGTERTVVPADRDFEYNLDGRTGIRLGQVNDGVEGLARVAVAPTEGLRGDLAFGDSPRERLSRYGLAGVGLAGLATVAGIGIMVRTGYARSTQRRRWATGDLPPSS